MKKRIALILGLLGALSLACNIPTQITVNTQPETGSEVSDLALTVTAQAQLLADINNETSQENAENSTPQNTSPAPTASTANNTPTTVASPTPATTSTPNKPTASVSIDTNCRTGPGQVYGIVGALLIGESAEVTGKNIGSNYWIIKNPDSPTTTCWLWGQYATVSGNLASLPEISIPPTPTPVPTATPVITIPAAPSNLSETSICYDYQTQVSNYLSDGTLTWQDNSNNEDGFTIYRKNTFVAGSVFYPIGTVGPNVTSYRYNAGHYGTPNSVKFKVEAFNSAGAASSGEISPDMSICP